jgi:hypothetical protein
MGVIHYGRAIALARLGRPAEALQALRRASQEAPWLPDLEARQAELLVELEDYERAWYHALRGHLQGSDIGAVVDRLQAVAPRPAATHDRPGLKLLVEIDRIRQRNERVEARARLTLRTADDKKLSEVSLNVPDVASTDEVSTAVARAMARVRAAIDEFRSDGPQP